MSNIVILHGWGSNSLRWQRVRELLEEKGIKTLILDLPGFGITSSPSRPWNRDDYIKWIFQKIKEKNWHKFYLLGHSFGGGLSLKIAANFPEKVEKLILCAPAIIRRRCLKSYLFYWLAFLGKKVFSLPGLRSLQPYAQRLIYKLAGTRDYYVADGVMKETMKKLHQEGLEGFLEKVKTPVLIVWGEKDDVLPVKDAYEIKEKIKNSELEIIPKAKHSPHREVPDELAEIIINFLQ